MLQDAGHLTDQVVRGRDVEQVRLGGMKVAHRPFPKRAVARQMQVSPGAQRSNAGGLSGRFDVGIDPVNQAVTGSLRVLRDHPRAKRFELLCAGEGAFAPGCRHGPPNGRGRNSSVAVRRGGLEWSARNAALMALPILGRCRPCVIGHDCHPWCETYASKESYRG